jgi:hypothetical protein
LKPRLWCASRLYACDPSVIAELLTLIEGAMDKLFAKVEFLKADYVPGHQKIDPVSLADSKAEVFTGNIISAFVPAQFGDGLPLFNQGRFFAVEFHHSFLKWDSVHEMHLAFHDLCSVLDDVADVPVPDSLWREFTDWYTIEEA